MATDHNFKVKKGLNILNGNLVIDSTTHNYIELDSGATNTKTWRFYNGQGWNQDALLIYNHTNDSTVLTIEPGKLGINRGANSASHTLDVGGSIAISGTEVLTASRNLTNLGNLNGIVYLKSTNDAIGLFTNDLVVGNNVAQQSTSTPKRLFFNNDYSSGYTDASLKLYLFNDSSTKLGFTTGPAYDLQYHSSGASSSRHAFYVQNVEEARIDAGGIDIRNGGLDINGTSIIDSSRNVTAGTSVSSTDYMRITAASGGKNILIGNQDSAGVNKPAMINGVNGRIRLGHGSTWSGNGGTFTSQVDFEGGNIDIISGNLELNGTARINNDGTADFGRVRAVSIGRSTTTTSVANINFWDATHSDYPGQVHVVSRSSGSDGTYPAGQIRFWNYTGSAWERTFTFDHEKKLHIGDESNYLQTQSSGNKLRHQTNHGYIDFGPANTGHAHIETDRSNFYFNKEITVDGGVIGSYDEDLYLRRARTSNGQMQLTTDLLFGHNTARGNSGLLIGGFIAESALEQGSSQHFYYPGISTNTLAGANRRYTVSITKNGTTQGVNDNMFLAGASNYSLTVANSDTVIITITGMTGLSYGAHCGIVFGNSNWRAKNVKIETSTDGGSSWTTRIDLTNQPNTTVWKYFTSGGTATNAIRYTLTNFNTTSFRINHLFAYNYNAHDQHFAELYKDNQIYAHWRFVDNRQARFGTSDDMTLYHDGTNSIINNQTGVLYIDQNVNDGNLILRSDNGSGGLSEYIVLDGGTGSTKLKHYGSTKLETTSTGASVTGDLAVSGDLNITGDINSVSVTDLDVVDKTITVGQGQAASSSTGSGLAVAGANVNILWHNTNDQWEFSKPIQTAKVKALASGMSEFSTHVSASSTNNDDWQNSPITIRERGAAASNSNTADKYAPNLNFHWAPFTSRSMWMDQDGSFYLGEYSAGGEPSLTNTQMSNLGVRGLRIGQTQVIDENRNYTGGAVSGTSANFSANSNFFPSTNAQLGIENQTSFVRLAFYKLSLWEWNVGEQMVIDGGKTGIGRTPTTDRLEVEGNLMVTSNIKHNGLTMTSGTDIDQLITTTVTATLSTSWQDTGINGTDLATGTYIVSVFVNDNAVSGQHYSETYSGVMSWYSANTNSSEHDEIVLHRAGHAPNAADFFLRTERSPSADTNDLMLQMRGSTSNTGNSNYVFKFRRMI